MRGEDGVRIWVDHCEGNAADEGKVKMMDNVVGKMRMKMRQV